MMMAIYFLLGVFALSILGLILAIIGVFKFKDDRGALAFFLGIVLFIVALVSGCQAFWRLEALDKAAATQQIQRP